MPTVQHHLASLSNGLIATTADRVALAAAGIAGSTPLWREKSGEVSDFFALIGPILAGVFVLSRIVLTWIQIWKAACAAKLD
jgi:hypothetical protein